jgi:ElaB/YqjD/DUF883 family membrane-anchored ribosome-binding protein
MENLISESKDLKNKLNGKKSHMEHSLQETLHEFTNSVTDLSNRVKSVSSGVARESMAVVTRHPIYAIACAALIGFVMGAASRKTKSE